MGHPLLIINDYKTAIDLLEKRSATTSDRKQTVMNAL